MTKQKQNKLKPSKPHPLKGIINSNDDPMACAHCSQRLKFEGKGRFIRMWCCGKWICLDCDEETWTECPFCSCPGDRMSGVAVFTRLKKMAKKGHVWGQYQLGNMYYEGDEITGRSYADAFRWFSKACKKNHPEAHMFLGNMLLQGHGCAVDLDKARRHLECALVIEGDLTDQSQSDLAKIASRYFDEGSASGKSEAMLILLPLAEERMSPEAQFRLGQICLSEGQTSAAYGWFCLSALTYIQNGNGHGSASINAFICTNHAGNLAHMRYWSRSAKAVDLPQGLENRRNYVHVMVRSQRLLREVRDSCGGCGAEFEGKERKFCSGCRAYCYCSRDCQKMHWNRKENGHREDCKGLTELKQKMKEAKRMSMLEK